MHQSSTSPTATDLDLCPHFGECGGCQSQDQPYAQQLADKERDLRELFAEFWQGPIPITPSPLIWHYRNKAGEWVRLREFKR